MSPDQISGNAEAVLWTMATLAASFMLIRSIVNDFLPNEVRVYRLDRAEHIPMVFNSYLPFLMKKSRVIQEEFKAVKLYTTDYQGRNTKKCGHPQPPDDIPDPHH
ncbi:hypothetical protein CRG98_041435 [Punica granatum]|uniref:Uncharacterized protein n=1 Tax=Punica granatum TaxID=22663 RepID=A0A2I0I2K2_PUNGR|nr:hypothetical protein CRG98_041435 [Punica granatum]